MIDCIIRGVKEISKPKENGLIYLIKGEQDGKAAWMYALINKENLPLFKCNMKKPVIDVSMYGRVLYSGFGKAPPQIIQNQIKLDYS